MVGSGYMPSSGILGSCDSSIPSFFKEFPYNGILLSFKEEHIWVSPNEVDEPRAYYTEWQRKTIIVY